MDDQLITLDCLVGAAANRRVLIGYAPANLLKSISFADVLNEETGRGYQRRFNSRHSLDFRRYIQQAESTTIPLTFNLRPRADSAWRLYPINGRQVKLELSRGAGKLLAQVDCQHRLGHLDEINIELPFMCFIGLTEREEMEVFNVINSKARGLSTSLLDFHDAQLSLDLASDRPELFIALFLNNESASPWYRQLDLGGSATSGMTRRASLRTMQKAIKRFLSQSRILTKIETEQVAQLVLEFWAAVVIALPREWTNPRKHFLVKGIGVYALMELASDMYLEAPANRRIDRDYFAAALTDFSADFDWSTDGPLKGYGGEGGVKEVLMMIREVRRKARFKVVSHG